MTYWLVLLGNEVGFHKPAALAKGKSFACSGIEPSRRTRGKS